MTSNYDNDLWKEGIKYLAGIDEVGRGPLAGPVVASAVILDPKKKIYKIDDSKKLCRDVGAGKRTSYTYQKNDFSHR